MTTADFRAWLERRGLTHKEAAELLAAHEKEVARWAIGDRLEKPRKVPRRVVRIMELMDQLDAASGAATHEGE